jgi:hypothetical protein
MLQDVMLDLETMGTGHLAPIMSIGAVKFDLKSGRTDGELYFNVSLKDCMDQGMKPDASTIEWWLNQSQDARKHLFDPEPVSLEYALSRLYDFCKDCFVWGNGATFDNRLVLEAFDLIGMKPSWKFYQDMDVRTLVRIGKLLGIDYKDVVFDGVKYTKHTALADSKHQVAYCHYIYDKLIARGAKVPKV